MTQSVETSCQKSSFVINKASSSVLLCLIQKYANVGLITKVCAHTKISVKYSTST